MTYTQSAHGSVPEKSCMSIMPGPYFYLEAVPDGSGGVFITWCDYSDGNYIVYITRLDRYGNYLWDAEGISVCNTTEKVAYPLAISDGSGGVIISWTTHSEIIAQRLDESGNKLWSNEGVFVGSPFMGHGFTPHYLLISDCSGGVIIVWQGPVDVLRKSHVYAQRIDTLGNRMWGNEGVTIYRTNDWQQQPVAVSDNSGGMFIAWAYNSRDYGITTIFTQRVDASGNLLWGTYREAFTEEPSSVVTMHIVSDGSQGAIIVWERTLLINNNDYDSVIYAQRIDATGKNLWGEDRITVVSGATWGWPPLDVIPDGSGGAIITWHEDHRDSSNIFTQRVNESGINLWGKGVKVGVATGLELPGAYYETLLNGSGGVIIAWQDYKDYDRNKKSTIVSQMLDASGNKQWSTGGIAIDSATGSLGSTYLEHRLVTDGSGGGIIVVCADEGLNWLKRYLKPQSDIIVTHIEKDVSPPGTPRSIPLINISKLWLVLGGVAVFVMILTIITLLIKRSRTQTRQRLC